MLHAKLNFMFTIQRCMPSRTFFRLAPSFSFDCNAFTIELTFRFWIPLFHLLLLFLLISFSKWIFVCLPLKHKVRIKKMHSEWTTCRAACTNSIIWWHTEGKKGEEWKISTKNEQKTNAVKKKTNKRNGRVTFKVQQNENYTLIFFSSFCFCGICLACFFCFTLFLSSFLSIHCVYFLVLHCIRWYFRSL